MKRLLLVLMVSLFFVSCDHTPEEVGVKKRNELPEELKGLKVHYVPTDYGQIYVATLDKNINSLTYRSGKHSETVIMMDINNGEKRVIEAKEVVYETDSLLLIKKK